MQTQIQSLPGYKTTTECARILGWTDSKFRMFLPEIETYQARVRGAHYIKDSVFAEFQAKQNLESTTKENKMISANDLESR